MKNKALPHEQNENVRAALREVLVSRHANNVSSLAKALGISQSMVHEFMNGQRGAGMKILHAAAAYTGRSVDELLSGVAPAPPIAATAVPSYEGDAITAFIALAEDKVRACEYAAHHATRAFRARSGGSMTARRYLEALQEDFARWTKDHSALAVGDAVVPQAPELPASRPPARRLT